MEREYKWRGTRPVFDALCHTFNLHAPQVKQMNACYFDTPDGLLRSQKFGLRLRWEDDISICCLKLQNQIQNGCHTHEEYECSAKTILEGLENLPAQGAPAALCNQLRHTPLICIAQINFSRTFIHWIHADFIAELCFDEGTLANPDAQAAFSEIECEYQSGDFSSFASTCHALEKQFVLLPESDSKLARALSLSKV